MSILFKPKKIKNMTLENRFVRSATYDGLAERTGRVSEKQIKLFSELSEGGIGLIVTGITHVHPSGQISGFQNAITSDEYVPGFERLTKAVHERGARIAIQLFHGVEKACSTSNTRRGRPLGPLKVLTIPTLRSRIGQ